MRHKPMIFIVALVAVTALLVFGAAVDDAKADVIMFPWIVKSPTISTLISVVNTAEPVGGAQSLGNAVLHYQYWGKDGSTGQTDICSETDFDRPTSKDDIVMFDAAGNINSGEALFEPTASPTTNVNYGNANFSYIATTTARAFLLVDNNIPQVFTDDLLASNADGTLYGEALVIDLGAGAAWGYIAFNASGGVRESTNAPVSFADGNDVLGEVIGNSNQTHCATWNSSGTCTKTKYGHQETTAVTLLPPSVKQTKFFTTPVNAVTYRDSTGVQYLGNQRDGTINNRIQLLTDPFHKHGGVGGIFDADENVLSFGNQKNIVCTSGDVLASLFGSAGTGAYTAWVNTGAEGWAYVKIYDGTIGTTPNSGSGMIVGKLEFTTGPIAIDGVTINGGVNNLNWLRNSESYSKQMAHIPDKHAGQCQNAYPCGGGINCLHNVSTFGNGWHGPFDPRSPHCQPGDGATNDINNMCATADDPSKLKVSCSEYEKN
ncbi:MAG: hypothetical protein ACLPX5_08090 [Dissulfurispiraceae bacterium]